MEKKGQPLVFKVPQENSLSLFSRALSVSISLSLYHLFGFFCRLFASCLLLSVFFFSVPPSRCFSLFSLSFSLSVSLLLSSGRYGQSDSRLGRGSAKDVCG